MPTPPDAGSKAMPAPVDTACRRALARAFRRGRRAHAVLDVPASAYHAFALAAARRRLARTGRAAEVVLLAGTLDGSRAEDLYLACACVRGVPHAWERLHAELGGRLRALLASRGVAAVEAERMVAEALGNLAVRSREPDGPLPLESYTGAGTLFGWLATILLRTEAREHRRRAREPRSVAPEEPSIAAVGAPASTDPARRALEVELEQRLRAALGTASARMTPREQAALVLAYRDGWSGKEVARLLGVGPPRVSRLLAQATAKVRDAVAPLLAGEARGIVPDDATWPVLRDAVGRHLEEAAIPPPPPAPPFGKGASSPEEVADA